MLCAHNQRVDPLGLAELVPHGDLTLAVRLEPPQDALPAGNCQTPRKVVGKGYRQWHELVGLVAGKANHHALVPSAKDLYL